MLKENLKLKKTKGKTQNLQKRELSSYTQKCPRYKTS
jgi:hypothetical protein